jgi:hypothetical protein
MSETVSIMVCIWIGLGVWVITIISALVGAYLMFKGTRAVPGEGFLGGVPKGQVFSIPEVDNAEEFPDTERNVLKKTEDFLKMLGGKQNP